MSIQTLKKRLAIMEAERKQAVIKDHVPISETIALYTKYLNGEFPVPDDMKERWEDWMKYDTPEIRKFLDQICPEDKDTWPVR